MKKEENKKEVKKNVGGAGDGLFFDKKSKTWGFRAVRDGKDTRKKGFQTKTEAKQARAVFLVEYKDKQEAESAPAVVTLADVFNHYRKEGCSDKREGTVIRHDSLWRCHVGPKFGHRDVTSFSPGEVNNYLAQLYAHGDDFNNFEKNYAFEYVEGFLKFFYLLFGYSRRMGWIDKNLYNDLCTDDYSRITMPKRQDDDEEGEIETFSREEIARMRDRIKGSSLYVAFEIGFYCGLRLSETFGLMWDDIDFENKLMTVRRQMLKSGVHRVLVPLKTTTAKRVIDIPDKLMGILKQAKQEQEENKKRYGTAWKGTETVRVRMRVGQDDPLTAGAFINRMEDGQLLTSDSMKSWAKNFKAMGIYFKYHNLRHTHASYLAAINVPIPKLMERLGHKKIETTQKYYFGKNELADEKMREALNSL